MMKLRTGDLVHVPAGAYRIKFMEDEEDGQMHIPWNCNLSMKPLLGIFKEHINERECVVLFHDGEWVVDSQSVYVKNKGDRNVRINKHNKDWANLAS
ncbi:MAG: hypothetical protein GOVbin1807_29 [Prokaryotic dsDNA virus sp.]|nr:MAG: hypothetical protein GOVbin1807_29 [Prokaryotic dsDNA virus sp.]|tara:strand:- start:6548 stop:6838 length:291 start_codon:yes stop_codon:yes gene_type:complete